MIRGNHIDMVKKSGDVSDMVAVIVDHMATKDDIAELKDEIADIRSEMTGMREEIKGMATKDDLAALGAELCAEMATKAHLEDMEERIMDVIRPMSRAQV